ncbi:hypothetical protein [Mycolicibacter acidiphilus]|nr:hypothetical protein [Mycolicibacter acidiphilus]
MIGAVAGAVLMIAAGLPITSCHRGAGGGGRSDSEPAAEWSTPAGAAMMALDRAPVQAWQRSAVDLGLPADTGLGRVFATSGDNAYLFTSGCIGRCGDRPIRNWVYGIDSRTGAPLFAPVELTAAFSGTARCYSNGPRLAVCVGSDQDGSIAVVDLQRGVLNFAGVTDWKALEVWGSRPVVNEPDGFYGIGAHGERTWHYPGRGAFIGVKFDDPSDDDQRPEVAVRFVRDATPAYRVVSLLDGADRTPVPPAGIELKAAAAYTGGFAYQYRNRDGSVGVLLYDDTGRLLNRVPMARNVLWDNPVLPTVLAGAELTLYRASGEPVITVPAAQQVPSLRVAGDTLFVWQRPDGAGGALWKTYDLSTGRAGSTCRLDMYYDGGNGYLGTDGHTVVDKGAGGMDLVGTDLTGCRTVWTVPVGPIASACRVAGRIVVVTPEHLTALRQPD